MTTPQWVTANGLEIPAYDDVLSEVEAAQKANVDPNLDTTPKSILGEVNASIGATARDLWEAVRIAYDGFNPNASEDFVLDGLCQLTGTIRTPDSFSTVTETVTLASSTTLVAGCLIGQVAPGVAVFVTIEDVSSTTAGDYPVKCRAVAPGPVAANAGTLTVITTPQTGLTAATNATDAVLGRFADTDAQLRIRRQQELRASGNATVDAILARLEALRLADGTAPIIEAAVVENTSDLPDALGRPPHSFECLIYDGDVPLTAEDDVYAQTIWDAHPAGIPAYGTNSSGTAIDTIGVSRTVRFTRPTIRPIKVQITIATVGGYAGDAAVKAYILATFLAIRPKIGSTGVRSVKAAAFADVIDRGALGGVAGVSDLTDIQLGFVSGSFDHGNLVLGARDMPTLDTSDIIVVVV
jgi:hypothetical protein